jgi:hypothetical protein
MKYFFCHIPFGKKKAYVEEINKASLERLAHLIKVAGMLMQAKIYLFWKNSSIDRSCRAILEEFISEPIVLKRTRKSDGERVVSQKFHMFQMWRQR